MKRKRMRTIWSALLLCLLLLFLSGCGEKQGAAAYVEQGMEALEKKDFAGAKAALLEAEQLAPGEPRVLRAMGIVYYEEGNYEEAMNYFSQALLDLGEHGEGSIREDILQYKVDAEFQCSAYEEAEADCGLLISLDNECAEYYLLRGKARVELGKTEEAVQDFRTALEFSPGNWDYCEDIYLTFEEQGNVLAGMEFLEKLCLAGPAEGEESRYTRACLELSLLRMENGLYEEALSLIEESLPVAKDPVRKELLYGEAVCYERLGDFETALTRLLSYRDTYGADEKVDHEIAFLETRGKTVEVSEGNR
ncbi:MAG: tetratricopeptide repeat protein [Lachnospiraceae bacterium]|nr:tetratricopeptide repeat protein [Lachnospiraceae bacterium]